MGNCTIFYMFENPRRGRQARNFTTNVSKIVDLKSSSEQIFFRKLSLGAPDYGFLRRPVIFVSDKFMSYCGVICLVIARVIFLLQWHCSAITKVHNFSLLSLLYY